LKILEFRTSNIASSDYSEIIQQTLVWWSPGLLDLFCRPWVSGEKHM